MADGTVKILTDLDTKGFELGLKGLQGVAKTGFGAINSAISLTGGALSIATTALTGFGASAIKAGANFESQMSKVQAISGASAEEIALLEEKAKEMGKSTQFSASESAQALEYMALAGWGTSDMLDGLSGIMDLAAASGEDLGLVSDILTDGLSAFGMSANESGKFADVLAATAANANTNVAMLGESFKYVAPVAGALNYNVEDVSVALGLMANAGIKASSSGTALRTLMSNLSAPSKTVATAMSDLGISLTDANGQMLPFSDVLVQLRSGFDGLSESQKAQYAEMLAGKEGMSAVLAMVNASSADFDKLSESINNSSGKASEMAAIMQDNLQGQFTLLKSNLEGLSISLYEELQEPLKGVVKYANEMVTSLSEAFEKGGLSRVSAEIGNIFAQLLTDLSSKAPEFLNLGFSMINSFLIGINANSNTIGQNAGTLITTFAHGIITNLPRLIITATQLIQSFLNGILENLPLLIESGSAAVDTIVQDLVKNLPKILDTSIKILLTLARGIISNLPTLMPAIVDIVLSIVETIIDNLDMLLDVALDLIVALTTGIIDSIPVLIEKLPIIIMKINEFFANPANLIKILDAGLQILIALANGILQSIFKILETVPVIIAKFVSGLLSGVNKIFDAGKELVNGLINGIKSMFGKVGDTVKNLGKNILDKIKGFFKIKSPSQLMRDEVGVFIGEGVAIGISSKTNDIVQSLTNPYKIAKNDINTIASEFANGNIQGLTLQTNAETSNNGETDNSGGLNLFNLFQFFNPENLEIFILEVLTPFFEQLKIKFFEFGSKIMLNFEKGFTSKIQPFFKTLEKLKQTTLDILNKLFRELQTSLDVMESQINSKMEVMLKTVEEYTTKIIDTMQKVLDIHSPSRKTMWMADMLHEGFVGQFKKNKNDLIQSAKENFNFVDYIQTSLPELKAMSINSLNSLIPFGNTTNNSNNITNNTTNNGGDFIINIEKVENSGEGSIESLLSEAEFYRKQQGLAFGGG